MVAEAEGEAQPNSLEHSLESRTAQEIGRERFNRAKEWLVDRWDGAKNRLANTWGFVKRLGIALGEASVKGLEKATYAAFAPKETVQESYHYVSKITKEDAGMIWENAITAYQEGVEIKDRVVNGAKERWALVKEKGRQAREGLVAKINNFKLRREVAALLARLDQETEKVTQVDKSIEEARLFLSDLEAKKNARTQAISELNQRIAELQAQLMGLSEAGEASAV